MQKVKKLTTIEEIKVYSDPYRLKILLLVRRNNAPMTVKQIADKMNEVPAKVYYHVKKMEKVGILEIVKTEQINGIIAKYYSVAAESFNIENSYIDDVSKKIFNDEVTKVISQGFDEARDIYLEQLKHINLEKKDSKTGTFTLSDLEIEEDEIQEFRKDILKVVSKYEKKKNESSKKCMLCLAMIPIIKEK